MFLEEVEYACLKRQSVLEGILKHCTESQVKMRCAPWKVKENGG